MKVAMYGDYSKEEALSEASSISTYGRKASDSGCTPLVLFRTIGGSNPSGPTFEDIYERRERLYF